MAKQGGFAEQLALVGDKELLATLDDMKDAKVRSALRSSIRYGLTPIRKEVKRRVPGRLKKLVEKQIKTTNKGNVLGYISFKESNETITVEGREVGLEVAANFLEFGTPHIKAQANVRGAREAKKNEAFRRYQSKLDERIDAEWKKAAKKHKSIFK